jgi:hypothetical protein
MARNDQNYTGRVGDKEVKSEPVKKAKVKKDKEEQ